MAEIHSGETEVHGRLVTSFIQRDQHAGGLDFDLGLETLEAFGDGIEGVVNAFTTEEQTITQFHVHASSRLT